MLTQINAQPFSKHDWHWRLNVGQHGFGHAAAPETVEGTLALLDDLGIQGEIAVRDAVPQGGSRSPRCGAGRSRWAQEFRRRRSQ